MNHQFNPVSTSARALLGVGSLIASILIVGSTLSLAEHYSAGYETITVVATR